MIHHPGIDPDSSPAQFVSNKVTGTRTKDYIRNWDCTIYSICEFCYTSILGPWPFVTHWPGSNRLRDTDSRKDYLHLKSYYHSPFQNQDWEHVWVWFWKYIPQNSNRQVIHGYRNDGAGDLMERFLAKEKGSFEIR